MSVLDFSNVGGSIGYCLANIDKYESTAQFMAHMSKRAALGSSFSLLMVTLPIMSLIFIAGGFSYSFYYIFQNKNNNLKRKFQQIGNVVIDAGSTIGAGILGVFIGQALIPVPFVGAIIGGIVGGLVG